jgi:hypothetical protein
MDKPWNTKMQIEVNDQILKKFDRWLLANNQIRKKQPLEDSVKDYFVELYDSGYGLKIIARTFNTSYSKLRTIFRNNNIDIRKGQSVVTDKLRQFRSERVKGTNNPWSDEDCRKNVHSFGIQGYYIKKDGQKIWLRSCWEYIYAKWLDKNNENWTYETKQFKLKNGETYRPDFFVDDYIVEIKGFNKDKLYKVDMLRKEYKEKIIVIEDIEPYTETNYATELDEWKSKKLEK